MPSTSRMKRCRACYQHVGCYTQARLCHLLEQACALHQASRCALEWPFARLSTMLLPDAEPLQGHWPLQWAALNNRYPVLQYLLSVCSYLPSTPLLPLLHALAPVPALPQKLYLRFIQACSPLADQWAHTGWTELATGLFITATVVSCRVVGSFDWNLFNRFQPQAPTSVGTAWHALLGLSQGIPRNRMRLIFPRTACG